MGNSSQHIHIELNGKTRQEIEAATASILKNTGFVVSSEDRGWVSIATEKNVSERGWPVLLAQALNIRVVCSWEMESNNSWGEDVVEAGSDSWSAVFRVEGLEVTVDGSSVLPENYRFLRYFYTNGWGVPRTSASDYTPEQCLEMATSGAIDPILGFAFEDPETTYFWLLVASDFDHEVDHHIGDLFEHTEFRYDDGERAALIELEVIAAYVLGDRVPKNIVRASGHLESFLASGNISRFDELVELGSAEPEFQNCLVRQLGQRPFWEFRQRLRRFETLHALNAPHVILSHEFDAMESEFETLKARIGVVET